jgi:hypothetical protein
MGTAKAETSVWRKAAPLSQARMQVRRRLVEFGCCDGLLSKSMVMEPLIKSHRGGFNQQLPKIICARIFFRPGPSAFSLSG